LVFLGVATKEGGKIPGYNAVSRLNFDLKKYAEEKGLFVMVSREDKDLETIVRFVKGISERTKTVLMKIDKKTYLSPFIGLFGLVVIFLAYLSRRFVATATLVLLLPFYSHAGETLGYFYYLIGSYERSAVEFLKEKTPKNLYNAGLSYYRAGEYDRAQSLLKQVNTEDWELKKKVLYTLALTYLAKKNYAEAGRIAEELAGMYPQDGRVRKLYHFTNMVLNMDRKEEREKTVVKIKERRSKQPKTSPSQIGGKNPW
ncbi:MAG: tetratricopeptide repeat protein, partial [Aquificae bacterium]|nr:tetratricopeptide repeat protein [Aquificota bacterium]